LADPARNRSTTTRVIAGFVECAPGRFPGFGFDPLADAFPIPRTGETSGMLSGE